MIGAMKAGTTTLFRRLTEHPGIEPCSIKEPGFFTHDDQWAKGHTWYRGLWPDQLDGRVRLEASTTMTKRPRFPHAPDRLARYAEEHGLDVHLIYSLRDPIDRIRSHLTHLIAGGKLTDQLTNVRKGSIGGNSLCISMYAMQLEAYLDVFDRDRIHLVRFEHLVEDPQAILDDIADALGLPKHPWGAQERVHNPTTGKWEKSPAWKVLEAAGLDRLSELMPDRLREPVRRALGDRIEGHVDLRPEQEQAYLRALQADLERLREAHGVDLDGWTLPGAFGEG